MNKESAFEHGQALVSSGASSTSGSGAGALSFFSSVDSGVSVSFMAPTNRPVKRPPLRSVLRKNSQVSGQPCVPLVKAINQPVRFLVYSGLANGLKNHE